MSEQSRDKITAALNQMVEAADKMFLAHANLLEAGDKATAAELDKVRDAFRPLRLKVASRLGEANKRIR
jgi:hypothetical protein